MKEIIDELVKLVEDRTETKVNRDIVLNSFYFVLASIISTKRLKYKTEKGEDYINFFGVTMANQGEGKDTSLDAAEYIFSDILEKIPDFLHMRYKQLNGELPDGTKVEEEGFIIPTSWKVALRGSIEGMMRTANYYDRIDVGSLNVVSTEFGADFNREVVPLLTKLWQSAKAEGSTNVNEKYPPINDVPTNVLLFGSPEPFKRNRNKHEEIVEMIDSGFARRTFFVWVDNEPMQMAEGKPDIAKLKQYTEELIRSIPSRDGIEFSDMAEERMTQYKMEAIEAYNEQETKINRYRVRGTQSVRRLAAIIAISKFNERVEMEDVEEAIAFNEKSLDSMKKVVSPDGYFKQIYELLRIGKDYLSIIDFHNEGIVFKNKQEENYVIEQLERYTKYKNMQLIRRGSEFKLAPLPMTSLNSIIVSVNIEGRGEKGNNVQAVEIPFFNHQDSVERLVTSSKIDYFVFSHFENNKRSNKNAKRGQNCIAFDIDDTLSLEEAVGLLSNYTYIIYTTRNHRKDKHGDGKIGDRFRIIMPTKTKFFVDNEQHKEMMANIAELLGITSFDVGTREKARLWFPNPEAEVYTNEGELIDVTCCIPETEKEEIVMRQIRALEETNISENARINGMIRWTAANGIQGNRNNALYRLFRFVIDVTGDSEEAAAVVRNTNQLLMEPLDESEVEQICRRTQ